MRRVSVMNNSWHSDFVTNATLSVIFEKERMHNEKSVTNNLVILKAF